MPRASVVVARRLPDWRQPGLLLSYLPPSSHHDGPAAQAPSWLWFHRGFQITCWVMHLCDQVQFRRSP